MEEHSTVAWCGALLLSRRDSVSLAYGRMTTMQEPQYDVVRRSSVSRRHTLESRG